jgi:hypothetical protein
VDRLVVVGRGRDVPVVGDEQPQQQVLGEVGVLELVHQHVLEAGGDPRADVRLGAQEPERVQHEVAGVEGPRLGQHAVVSGIERGELLLARVLVRRPRRVVGGGDQLVLQPVDPRDDRAEHRARIAA